MKRLILILFAFICLTGYSQVVKSSVNYMAQSGGSPPSGNMISNGTFDSGTDWALYNGSYVISGGVATYDDVTNDLIYQDSASMVTPLAPNTDYKLTFTIVNTTATLCYIFFGNGLYHRYVAQTEYTTGTHTVYFTTPAAGTLTPNGFQIFAGDAGGAFTIDDILLELD